MSAKVTPEVIVNKDMKNIREEVMRKSRDKETILPRAKDQQDSLQENAGGGHSGEEVSTMHHAPCTC